MELLLNGLEAGTSAALVRYSAEQATALIAEVGGARPGLLAGQPMFPVGRDAQPDGGTVAGQSASGV